MLVFLACNERSDTPIQIDGKERKDTLEQWGEFDYPDGYFDVFTADTQLVYQYVDITLPAGWRLGPSRFPPIADATFRYLYHNKNGKPVRLEIGLGTRGNLAEPTVISARFRKGYVRTNADTSGLVFDDNPKLAEMRRKSDYVFYKKRVSSLMSTFFQPKQIGKGYSGVYIDSVGHAGRNIADLVVYAEDLDSLENAELVKVIQSLVIKGFMQPAK